MSTQGIYRGPLNFSRPADSYHIGPDGTPQLATYWMPEPRYGYDQLGNPQYGTDQIDAQGNIIPQYNRAMAARYDSAGNRLVGNTVSTSTFQGDPTYDPRVGTRMFTDTSPAKIDMTTGKSTTSMIPGVNYSLNIDQMEDDNSFGFINTTPNFNQNQSSAQMADESSLFAEQANQDAVRGPNRAAIERANRQAQSANVAPQSFEGVFKQQKSRSRPTPRRNPNLNR
tara:strand:+ start:160 stop:837 length:678 start_codon:yes stop_codon:yes gene_type:complete